MTSQTLRGFDHKAPTSRASRRLKMSSATATFRKDNKNKRNAANTCTACGMNKHQGAELVLHIHENSMCAEDAHVSFDCFHAGPHKLLRKLLVAWVVTT